MGALVLQHGCGKGRFRLYDVLSCHSWQTVVIFWMERNLDHLGVSFGREIGIPQSNLSTARYRPSCRPSLFTSWASLCGGYDFIRVFQAFSRLLAVDQGDAHCIGKGIDSRYQIFGVKMFLVELLSPDDSRQKPRNRSITILLLLRSCILPHSFSSLQQRDIFPC